VYTAPNEAEAAFDQLVQDEWAWRLNEFPRLATQAGEHQHDHRLERMDAASRAARASRWRSTRAALQRFTPEQLPPERRADLAVYANQINTLLGELEHGGALMPLDGDSAFYSYLPELWREQPLHTADQLRNHLGRLAAISTYFDDHIELLTEALQRGLVPPAVVMQGRDAPLQQMLAWGDARATPYFKPFLQRPTGVLPADFETLAQDAERVIGQQVLPAYAKLASFMRHQYLPRTRASTDARSLPGGEAFYAERVRAFTTLPLTAEQVHEQGLAEVARILEDMHRLMRACGAIGTLGDFLAQLRGDPKHYPTSAEELLGRASWIAKRVDTVLPRFFGKLPRQPFGVAPVPDDMAPYYTSGRYVPAAADSDQAALYWVNTCKLESRAWYALPALTLHEAVPGHHLQLSLAAENTNQPAYRRLESLSAHSEGWALYAEFLGSEMGIYQTPLEEFGRASYEMWRACRLVVDTGLHMKGWTRAQAQAYLRDHTALSEHELTTEVDRYIGWPGQALSYKVGEIEFRRLRTEAEATLGTRFDLRAFHDHVLAQGCVPLPALRSQVQDWAQQQMANA
jgi:uncharacterized protein (DUF885 family)